mmetsp:Transcript_28/g.100  ORF Transcript_28/g.100 Transcript_28/m.100 type:complete len:714 (+) Transcript_28:71-2212(+)
MFGQPRPPQVVMQRPQAMGAPPVQYVGAPGQQQTTQPHVAQPQPIPMMAKAGPPAGPPFQTPCYQPPPRYLQAPPAPQVLAPRKCSGQSSACSVSTPLAGTATGPPEEQVRQLQQIKATLRDPVAINNSAEQLFRKYDFHGTKVLNLEKLIGLVNELNETLGIDVGDPGPMQEKALGNFIRKYGLRKPGSLTLEEFGKLYSWLLLKRMEEIDPPMYSRVKFIGEMDVPPNQKYNTLKKIGEGTFGEVFLVQDKQTKDKRVMKIVSKGKALQKGTPLAVLEQEVKTLQMLDHPHILRLFEYFVSYSDFYFITDVVYGGELLNLVESEIKAKGGVFFDEGWVVRLMRQTLHAVAYCHQKGVMHKDIKLENIMLQNKEEPHAMIIDVGIAELFGAQHQRTNKGQLIAGTPSTIAPEVMEGNFSYKCDIWSLGCCCFALFCEKPKVVPDGSGSTVLWPYPFGPPTPSPRDPSGMNVHRATQMRGADLSVVSHASSMMKSLLSQMLTFSDQRRPTAAQCLMHPIFEEKKGKVVVSDVTEKTAKILVDNSEVDGWRRAVMLEAATQLPMERLSHLRDEFYAMDINRDGMVSTAEMVSSLIEAGVPEQTAIQCAAAADADGSGSIEFSEFCAMMLQGEKQNDLEAILFSAFQRFDKNNDGSISRAEVVEMLTGASRMNRTLSLCKKSADIMLLEMKGDKTDQGHSNITFDEFRKYFTDTT